MMKEEELKEQLGQLKMVTIRTGAIHEAQELQLQMWPLIVFPEATAASAKVSWDRKVVIFSISIPKRPKESLIQLNTERVTDWCRSILWNETTIEFKFLETQNVKRTRRKPQRSGDKTSSRRRT